MNGPSAYLIRRPALSDVSEIASTHVDGWRDAYGHLLPAEFYDAESLRRRVSMWTEILSRDELPERLFVAESQGHIAGFAYVDDSQDEDSARPLTLFMIYVRTDQHGTGIGQALLEAAARQDPLQLWMARDNPRAHAFYRRNGFALDGTERVDHDANDLEEIRLVR